MGEKTATEATKKVFGENPQEMQRVEQGLIHETYTVKLEDQEFILQFSGKDEKDHSPLAQCLKMYELLETTVPVPKAVTREVEEIDGKKFVIVEKIPGKSGEQNISPEKTREAGKELAKIHEFTDFEKEGWMKFNGGENPQEILEKLEIEGFREETSKRKTLSELEEKIEIFRGKGLTGVAEKTEEFVETHGEIFPENFGPVLVHDDFTPDNVLFREDTVSGIIDFDYAYSGLDVRNIVKSANSFWMHDPGADRDIRQNFYDGYSKERPLPQGFERLERFFRVETLVQLIGSMIELDELSEDELDFYREQILGELEASNKALG